MTLVLDIYSYNICVLYLDFVLLMTGFFPFSAAIIYQCSLVPRLSCMSLGTRLISVLKQLLERVARLESEQIQQFKSPFSFHLGCG